MKKIILVILVLCVGVGFGGVCREQLFKIGYLMGLQGYTCTYENYGNLNEDENQNYRVYLKAGHSYQIYAVCDSDCRDLDLKLYDLSGSVFARDVTDDDIPMVGCSVYVTGYYIVKINMYDCGNEPCGYGIAVFGR